MERRSSELGSADPDRDKSEIFSEDERVPHEVFLPNSSNMLRGTRPLAPLTGL